MRGEQIEAFVPTAPASQPSPPAASSSERPQDWWRGDITTRQRVLLTAQPLFRLLRADHHVTAEDSAHYDHFTLDPEGWPNESSDQALTLVDELFEFLPGDTRAAAATLIRAGRRIPEEVLGPELMHAIWS